MTLDRLLVEFPDNPYRREAQYLRAESALRNGDAGAAEKGFAALLTEPPAETDPKGMLPAVRLKRIQCWIALKRWKDALESARAEKGALASGDSARAELDYMTGQALLGLGQLENARAAFQSVLDVRKEGELAAQAQLMRGETYFHQDQFHEALRDFLKVDILHNSPRWQAAALLEAGKVYERLDQWADAAETYERLLSKFPAEPSAAEARHRLAAATRRSASKARWDKGLTRCRPGPQRNQPRPDCFPHQSSSVCVQLSVVPSVPMIRVRSILPKCMGTTTRPRSETLPSEHRQRRSAFGESRSRCHAERAARSSRGISTRRRPIGSHGGGWPPAPALGSRCSSSDSPGSGNIRLFPPSSPPDSSIGYTRDGSIAARRSIIVSDTRVRRRESPWPRSVAGAARPPTSSERLRWRTASRASGYGVTSERCDVSPS